jgi:Protein DA1
MPLPAIPPLLLVQSSALNNAEAQETSGRGRGGGPIFHTRGLCLTEYTAIQKVIRQPGGIGSNGFLSRFAVKEETVQLGPVRCDVTAILVLYGLPRLLTGSILAHECMHAWLRLSGFPHLSPEVEEGLCQLMALLWLEAQHVRGFHDAWEERLAAFFGNQIRTDSSYVYGEGFRAVLEAYQRFGLKSVLDCVSRTGRLPV